MAIFRFSLSGVFGFWNLFGRRLGYVLGPWAAAALATTGAAEHPQFAHVLALRALYHFNHQRIDEAERDARRAIDLLTAPGSPFSIVPWSALFSVLVFSGRAPNVKGAEAFLVAARATGDDYTIASAVALVASWWYVLGNLQRCLSLAEEATLLAQRVGNPTSRHRQLPRRCARNHRSISRTTPPRDGRRARERRRRGVRVAVSLAWLARMGGDATSPQWATQFRSGLTSPTKPAIPLAS